MFAYEFPDALCCKKILGLLNDQDGGNRSDSSEITAQDFGFMASVEKLDLSGFDQKPSTSAMRHYHFNAQGESLEDPYNKDHGIASLKGIEHFTALKELNCSDTQLSELDVSNNTALKALKCYDNKLAGLDLSNNTVLEKLKYFCRKNAFYHTHNHTLCPLPIIAKAPFSLY